MDADYAGSSVSALIEVSLQRLFIFGAGTGDIPAKRSNTEHLSRASVEDLIKQSS